MRWDLIAGFAGGAAIAWGSYYLGRIRGAQHVARRLFEDRDMGRAVLERLATQHGARLELTELGPPSPAER